VAWPLPGTLARYWCKRAIHPWIRTRQLCTARKGDFAIFCTKKGGYLGVCQATKRVDSTGERLYVLCRMRCALPHPACPSSASPTPPTDCLDAQTGSYLPVCWCRPRYPPWHHDGRGGGGGWPPSRRPAHQHEPPPLALLHACLCLDLLGCSACGHRPPPSNRMG